MKHKIKKTVLLTSLLILTMVAVGGTLAYLFDTAGPVENTFTPTSVPIKVEESFGNNVKSNVKITNTGTDENATSAYIRATVVKNWLDAETKNVVYLSKDPSEYSQEKSGDYFDLIDNDDQTNSEDWIYHKGYFYYSMPVAPEGSTSNLINTWSINYTENPEYILQVDILAQSVQSTPVENNVVTAAQDLWGVTLTVANDGTITKIK